MPTPTRGYVLADGSRVPGTTTILSRWKESGGLIHWAYQCGVDGIDYRSARDDAGGVGTLAHRLVELRLEGRSMKDIEAEVHTLDAAGAAKALSAFEAYLTWERHSKIEIVAREIQMVSEVHRYGGTPDAIGRIDGELCLLDWKTGGVYLEALMQVSAYRVLWEEHHPDQPLTGGFHICRFSKTEGDFTHRYFKELDLAREQFLILRRAFENDKILKKRIA
jgi:hypothetical protein